MADARDVLTNSEMCALRDVYKYEAKVDWALYDSAIAKIREHDVAPETQRHSRSEAREATA
jgi:hypothetical protein